MTYEIAMGAIRQSCTPSYRPIRSREGTSELAGPLTACATSAAMAQETLSRSH